ncbi:MAG TPA: winged helix-turn-helix transcriptional regulator [Candidatus Thermoplasmatota archaeon]|nr:winged helix-turn-helix transcriptional regulator [Candidatus Thermoplasmatota archaeon]
MDRNREPMAKPVLVLLALLLAAPVAVAQETTCTITEGVVPDCPEPPPAPASPGDAGQATKGAAPEILGGGQQAQPATPAPVSSPLDGGDDPLFGNVDLGTGLAIGIGATLVAAAAAFFFLGGAKFVNAQNVLDNEARRQIFAYVQAHPGVHLRAAASQLNLSTTNVLWHLRKLEGANLVTSKKFEGYKVFYPVEGGVETKRRALASSVLKNENAAHILQYVSSNPSAHQREIARALGVNHGTIRWHLRKLEEAELLAPVKKEHTTHYYVSDLGREALGGFAQRVLTPPAPPAPPTAEVRDDGS